ncbi:NAD(P)-dependent oxidoreductase [Planctomycetota bacterium]|nr:NAD(P)-dependent oxidoreductase [Planctomycetota bacterium]
MNILMTGASSFTGCWFVKQLTDQGHHVVAIFQNSDQAYDDLRKKRIDAIRPYAQLIFECSFGDDRLLEVIKSENEIDLLCHHAADVTNYKSDAFDISSAVNNNCHNLYTVIESLKDKGCQHILLTGSIFEENEGYGCASLQAFNAYGFSKTITSQIFRYLADQFNMTLGKFVIPNPFGVFEEPRFTNYLCKTWANHQIPKVMTPDYVRDNIHVSLLSKAYVMFAESLLKSQDYKQLNPSGYVETQGAFTRRFAREMQKRIAFEFPVDFELQKAFIEPRIRYNKDAATNLVADWDETAAWDGIADYYDRMYQFS